MFSYHKFIVFATVILVTIPLLYLSLRPVYIVHISIQPRMLKGVTLLSSKITTQPDGDGVVFFDMAGHVEDSSIFQVIFSIRPSTVNKWYSQGSYDVSKGVFWGTAQLGSVEWPVIHDEQYSFRLSSNNDALLSAGDILVRVERIAGTNQWLIGVIGVVASLLQIFSFFVGDNRSKSSLETNTHKG